MSAQLAKAENARSGELAPREWLSVSPFETMRRLSEEMDRFFGASPSWRLFPKRWTSSEMAAEWSPRIEVFERKGELVVRADLPGMSREDVKVEIAGQVLTIAGERKHEKEEKGEGYYTSELSYGAFCRNIPLPDGVKDEEARASFKNGVLEVTMPAPKVPEKHGRRLDIKS